MQYRATASFRLRGKRYKAGDLVTFADDDQQARVFQRLYNLEGVAPPRKSRKPLVKEVEHGIQESGPPASTQVW